MKHVCDEFKQHPENIKIGKKNIPTIELLHQVSDFFDAFSTPTRLKILYSLSKQELCTCDLAEISEMSVSAVSHQLRILKDRSILSYRKEGKNVYYKLRDNHIIEILNVALTHLKEGIKHE